VDVRSIYGPGQSGNLLFNTGMLAAPKQTLAVRAARGAERAMMVVKTSTCFKDPSTTSPTKHPLPRHGDKDTTIRYFPEALSPQHALSYIHAVALSLPTRPLLLSVSIPLFSSGCAFLRCTFSSVVVFGLNLLTRLVLFNDIQRESLWIFHPVTLSTTLSLPIYQNTIQNAVLNTRLRRSFEPGIRYVHMEEEGGA
jgi:hypothetical protein